MKHITTCVAILLFTLTGNATVTHAADAPGTTRVAQWKGDKACAFILMFDDSCISDVKTVVPELTKRQLTGTFYVNPGSGHYAAQRKAWEQEIPAAGFELANHTFTHRGGDTTADIAKEVTACNDAIHAATPNLPWPRLVSYGQPGGIKPERWPITKEQLADVLKENHLIDRPDFGGRGAMIAFKTSDQMLAHVDKAIAGHAMECIVFHGVGGDWIVTPTEVFTGLLDGLVARRDKVWITGHIPAHQYATERDAATVRVAVDDKSIIGVMLTTTADPQFYDQPLTLVTRVPADWKTCTVTQGETHGTVAARDGVITYDAMPSGKPIVIAKK
ncbi:MAG: polysaccharide deacetylase family protein [Phycisphaera sp.]|nr:polysaccharide deacetylase family protein [Phycisphaera sp.]